MSNPCPTCSGPSRETVGMICQTCGTDYGPAMSDLDLDAFNAVLEAHPTAWQYCGTDGTGVIADAVRAAVDAARAPLLAEVERLKQELDEARITIRAFVPEAAK